MCKKRISVLAVALVFVFVLGGAGAWLWPEIPCWTKALH